MFNNEEAQDAASYVSAGLAKAKHKTLNVDEWRLVLMAASFIVQHAKVHMHVAAAKDYIYRVDDDPDPRALACSMEELLAANEDAPIGDADVIQICSLAVGAKYTWGGGAAAECTVTRTK